MKKIGRINRVAVLPGKAQISWLDGRNDKSDTVQRIRISWTTVLTTSFPGFSPTRPTEREGETLENARTKLILREESFVSHFSCLVYSQRSRSDRNSKIDLLTLLQL